MTTPRVVILTRRSELSELLARHGTRGQAEFFLAGRNRTLADVERRHEAGREAERIVESSIPEGWRRASVERSELPRFVFGPEDVVVAVGQDGLVANVAKYLADQPVIGVDPNPGTNPGALVPHAPKAAGSLMREAVAGTAPVVARTMVEAVLDDGQRLVALNEIFVGQPSHQSARYRLGVPDGSERQCSSGVIVGTGSGASGWCSSIGRLQAPDMRLPRPEEPSLAWFVREPWPSPSTEADLVAGLLPPGEEIRIEAESDTLVVFGDGIEADRVTMSWGQILVMRRATNLLRTVG